MENKPNVEHDLEREDEGTYGEANPTPEITEDEYAHIMGADVAA